MVSERPENLQIVLRPRFLPRQSEEMATEKEFVAVSEEKEKKKLDGINPHNLMAPFNKLTRFTAQIKSADMVRIDKAFTGTRIG